jgi:lipopolysaccharide transport system permease protein
MSEVATGRRRLARAGAGGRGQPVTVITASTSWGALDPRRLAPYRDLLYFLVWRDLKVRFRQTILGLGWVLLQPVLLTIVFTLVLSRLVRVPADGLPYPVFVFAGLVVWTFLTSAIGSSVNGLIGGVDLVKRVYFPRVLIPLAAVVARLLDLVVAAAVFFVLLAGYGRAPSATLAFFPVVALLTVLLALAVGMAAAALNLRYRDVGLLLPVLFQTWLFASPVLYPMSLVPERWQGLYALNPMTGLAEGSRAALAGGSMPWSELGVSTVVILALLAGSGYVFSRLERTFADVA